MRLCDRFADDWELFELGALDGDQDAVMRAHVRECPACAARYRQAAALLAPLAGTLGEVAPPARVAHALGQKLRERASGGPPLAVPPAGGRRHWPLPAIAAALLACVCGGLLWSNWALRQELAARRVAPASASAPGAAAPAAPSPSAPTPPPASPVLTGPAAPASDAGQRAWQDDRRRLQEALADARARQDRAESEVVQLQERLTRLARRIDAPAPAPAPALPGADSEAHRREPLDRLAGEVRRLEAERERQSALARDYARALEAVLDARSIRVALAAIDRTAAGATASAVLTPEGRLLLMTRGLPSPGPDKCYQLWVIRRSTPAVVSGGVLAGGASTVHTTRVEGDLALVTGFAITDEPAGGSEVSRGRKLLFGALRQ